MIIGKYEVEDILIVTYIILWTIQYFNYTFEILVYIIDHILIIWLIYDKIPLYLNKRFSDINRSFTRDNWLKLGLIFFSSSMFTFFALNIYLGHFLLPSLFIGFNTLDLSYSIFGIILLIFISIYYFSWRLWKYEKLAHQLWKMTCWTETEYLKEVYTSEQSRFYALFSKYFGPGVIPTVVSGLLFMGWLIFSIIDPLMILLLSIWLAWNIISRTRFATAFSQWKNIDEDIIWNIVIRVGLSGETGIFEAIMIVIGITIIIFLAVIEWSIFIVIIIFLNWWYVLLILFQIGLRTSVRIKVIDHKINLGDVIIRTLPIYVDIILLFTFFLTCIFSYIIYSELIGMFSHIILTLSIILNASSLITIIYWLKKQEKKHRFSEKTDDEQLKLRKNLIRDRYRLYSILLFLGAPLIAVSGTISALILWGGIIYGFIFLSYIGTFRKKIIRKKASEYASLLTCYFGLGIFVILGASIIGLPELRSFITKVGIFFAIFLIIYWLAVFRVKRRWKWTPTGKNSSRSENN